MNSKIKKMVNNTFIFLIGNIGAKFIQFLLVPLYTYTLSTEQYGITELVLTAVNLLMPLFSVSIADGLLRFALDKKYKKENVLKSSLVIIFGGTILSIIMIPIFRLNKVLNQWIVYFILILNLRIYRDIFAIYLKTKDKNKLFAIDGILYTFILCLCSFAFLVFFNLEIKGYFLAYIIANIVSIIFLMTVGHTLTDMVKSKVDKNLIKSLFIYSVPMVINGISWWITNASDRYMLEWMMTNSDVGIYSIATKIPTFITTFTGVFNQAWIISAVVEYDDEKEKKFYSEIFHKYYFLLFFGTAMLLTILRPFMKVYVSENFFISWRYAAVLVCSSVMSGIAAFTVGIYAATKKNLHVMITTLIGAVVNIVLNAYLIPIYGIMGASIATFISWLVIAFVRLIDIRKIFDFYINYKNILLYSLLVIFQCIAILFFEKWSYIVSLIVIIIILIKEKEMLLNFINIVKGKFKHD